MPEDSDIDVLFDELSANAHVHNGALLKNAGKKLIDLTQAATSTFTIPGHQWRH